MTPSRAATSKNSSPAFLNSFSADGLLIVLARARRHLLRYTGNAMKKIILFGFALASLSATAFFGDRHIAFERNNAVWIANLDGTDAEKIADGIFPAISPDGTQVAFNTVEETNDTT
jgi:tricorn protease-like protein